MQWLGRSICLSSPLKAYTYCKLLLTVWQDTTGTQRVHWSSRHADTRTPMLSFGMRSILLLVWLYGYPHLPDLRIADRETLQLSAPLHRTHTMSDWCLCDLILLRGSPVLLKWSSTPPTTVFSAWYGGSPLAQWKIACKSVCLCLCFHMYISVYLACLTHVVLVLQEIGR